MEQIRALGARECTEAAGTGHGAAATQEKSEHTKQAAAAARARTFAQNSKDDFHCNMVRDINHRLAVPGNIPAPHTRDARGNTHTPAPARPHPHPRAQQHACTHKPTPQRPRHQQHPTAHPSTAPPLQWRAGGAPCWGRQSGLQRRPRRCGRGDVAAAPAEVCEEEMQQPERQRTGGGARTQVWSRTASVCRSPRGSARA